MSSRRRLNKKTASSDDRPLACQYVNIKRKYRRGRKCQDVVEFGCRAECARLKPYGEGVQYIWDTWVTKTKNKARKVRAHMAATGGGPATSELTEIEEKIIYVVETASVYGFTNAKDGSASLAAAGLQLTAQGPLSPTGSLEAGPSSASPSTAPIGLVAAFIVPSATPTFCCTFHHNYCCTFHHSLRPYVVSSRLLQPRVRG